MKAVPKNIPFLFLCHVEVSLVFVPFCCCFFESAAAAFCDGLKPSCACILGFYPPLTAQHSIHPLLLFSPRNFLTLTLLRALFHELLHLSTQLISYLPLCVFHNSSFLFLSFVPANQNI